MPLTPDDLKTIVEKADFNKFVGEVENEFFDAKGQPYQFDAGDYAKREFAKDVTAFANAGGGYIFIGFRTEASAARLGEEIREVRPLPPELIDPDRHHKLIEEWVYPAPIGIYIQWIPFEGGPKGIGVIHVPPQEGRSKPFLIAKTIQEKKSTEILVGYAERKRDTTSALTVVELQQALRTGLNMEREILGRFDNIESTLERFFRATSKTETTEKLAKVIDDRVEFALQHNDLRSKRALAIAVYSTESAQLKTLFTKETNSIRTRLEHPPEIRNGGWDLGGISSAQSIKGELVRVDDGYRKVLDLYRDGCLIAVALADQNFLAWATNSDRKINPLALIELILNFTRFYSVVLDDFKDRPSEITFRIAFRNLHLENAKSFLTPYGIKSLGFLSNSMGKTAPNDNYRFELTYRTEDYDPDSVAYDLIREIYIWFGHTEEVIPYTALAGSKKKIDEKQIIESF